MRSLLLLLASASVARGLQVQPRLTARPSLAQPNIQQRCSLIRCVDKKDPSLTSKLENEARTLSFSWRTARYVIYGAFGIGALAGLAGALPDLLSGEEAAGDGIAGVVVDSLTLAAAAAGAYVDSAAASAPAPSSKSEVAVAPPLELSDWTGDQRSLRLNLRLSPTETKAASLAELQMGARQVVVLLGGPAPWVRECLVSARFSSELFQAGNVLIVPIATAGEAPKGKGFGNTAAWSDAPFVAEPFPDDSEAWQVTMQQEAEAAAAQGADQSQGVVLVLGLDGSVKQRRIGVPDWRSFVVSIAPGKFDESEVRRANKPFLAQDPSLEFASGCFFPTTWKEVPLVAKAEYNHDSTVYTFGLPEDQSLNLPVCACLLIRADGRGRKENGGKDDFDGTDAVRPYTPISDNSMLGKFELLVKRYDSGAASQWLHALPIGSNVAVKHIKFNIKAQYPFEGKKTISMVCAGTGITPCYQALWKIMGTPGDDRNVVLLYGNKSPEDILMKQQIDQWAAASGGRLKVVHVIGDRPDSVAPEGWVDTETYTAEVGWIDEAKIKKYCFPPSKDTLLFVCGLPRMYSALCGPRTEKEVAEDTVLHKLGYTSPMVAKL